MNYFANNLKYIRKRFGLTQAELALQLKTGQSTIATWENGSSGPDVDNLIKFNQTFDIQIDTLVLIDMEDGKVITDEHVKEFKRSGKVSGKLSGKVTGKKMVKYSSPDTAQSVLNEPDSIGNWATFELIKGIRQDIDRMRISIEELNKKINK